MAEDDRPHDDPTIARGGDASPRGDSATTTEDPQAGAGSGDDGTADGTHAEVTTDQARMGPDPADLPDVPAVEHHRVLAERDEYLDQLQRARADYDNLNKRRQREVAQAADRGAAALAGALLEVLDNFGFALAAAEQSSDEKLAKGVSLVHEQLVGVLHAAGLEVVPGVGAPFDPTHHEALMQESDDVDRDHPEVAEVLRIGYRFKDQLLRPAAVKVLD